MDFINWLIGVVLLTVTFLVGRALLVGIDSDLAKQSKAHKYISWVMVAYLFCASMILNNLWEYVFWVSLALAAYSDYLTCEIYDFIYVPAAMVCVFQLLLQGLDARKVDVVGLIIFICLQKFLFARFYGVSDCIAFSVCAMYMSTCAGEIVDYIMLMFWTFLLLSVVQLIKRNINKKGNLKKPVPLIPYIAVSMLCMQFA